MARAVTQFLVGLMLLFGFATLIPKAFIEFRSKRSSHGLKYALLGLLALFFSAMAFYYAWLSWRL